MPIDIYLVVFLAKLLFSAALLKAKCRLEKDSARRV